MFSYTEIKKDISNKRMKKNMYMKYFDEVVFFVKSNFTEKIQGFFVNVNKWIFSPKLIFFVKSISLKKYTLFVICKQTEFFSFYIPLFLFIERRKLDDEAEHLGLKSASN